ncbi:MAG TPA: YceI family protein [Paucimonas sp.]|nr:YceI family protein [Paucimonas sp.]
MTIPWKAGRFMFCAALLGGCAPSALPPAAPEATRAPAGFPEAYYRAGAAQRKILRIEPGRSLVVIEVRRGGPFARLGHDHVVSSRDVAGYVDPESGRADLYVPLDRLVVDDPALRAEARLDTQPSADDIQGTRRNMLVKVLEAERFPFALVHVRRASAAHSAVDVVLTLHGVTRRFEAPVRIESGPDGLTVAGRLAFNQTDFGMTPMSVLGGAIQVRDELELRFRIAAK